MSNVSRSLARRWLLGGMVGALSLSATAMAVPTIDGTLDPAYGSAISVQTDTNPSSLGQNNLGLPNDANGSELDAGYGFVSGGKLYLFIAGNLETSPNLTGPNLDVFIQTGAGGQNILPQLNSLPGFATGSQNNNPAGYQQLALHPGGGALQFDSTFAPNYFLGMTAAHTIGGLNPSDDYISFADLGTGKTSFIGDYNGPTGNLVVGPDAFSPFPSTGPNAFDAALNDSNVNNQGGAAVGTGYELAIPLSGIGNPSGPISVSVIITNNAGNVMSNQVLGPLPTGTIPTGLNPVEVNFDTIAGLQYFTIPNGNAVPVPAGAYMGLAGLIIVGGLKYRASRKLA